MATGPVIQELEPSVAKGLRLLHSSDPDSEDYLYQLWKQCVYEKYGSDRTPVSVLHKISIPTGMKRESVSEVDDEFTIETKKSKLQSPPLFQRSAPGSPQTGTGNTSAPTEEINLNSSSENDSDSNDSNREMLNGEGNCMKCKSSSFTKVDRLLECIDCHKFYHQQCHFPPMLDINTSDPRFVWRCSACEQHITTTTSSDRNKNFNVSSNNNKSSASSSSSKNVSSPVKNSRYVSGSSHNGSNSNSNFKSSNSKTESSAKSSGSSNSDKKSSHLMKKRSMKKPEKKKSSK